ncbi:TPR end-of-group domain-containing protein [Defluviicoccus vanus]|uniref:DUF4062 domain-containing protein n=1 Tax=Defluviicoccus vanus TaxID=111831 RepID=A0A7H1MYP2_9PROT|nr:DUF4062 domain-containing protein [Defluviicoccus vanus]QNT68578.1 DUF4062 domain-containing protein [Defluviicoccus vanus]
MPRQLTQYRIFIASPGGLQAEREGFRGKLEKFTRLHAEPRGVTFHPVGWEDTLGGAGRPQELINEDLRQCDFAVFVLHDRWGTPTGSGHTSGTEEEWSLAEQLYQETKLRNIALFFKAVEPRQLHDPGAQLSKVLDFKRQIEDGKRYLFKNYDSLEDFLDVLEGHLAQWLMKHENQLNEPAIASLTAAATAPVERAATEAPSAPRFEYWIGEWERLIDSAADASDALFCARKAVGAATSDLQWARASYAVGVGNFHSNNLEVAIATFDEITTRFAIAADSEQQAAFAKALSAKAITLGALGRSEAEIAVYDQLIARFADAAETPLREQVAKALYNKGVTLGALGRSEDAIAVYDQLIARFADAAETPLREPVAKALFNKGVRLGALGRSEAEIAVYDQLIARFADAAETPLREKVAMAFNAWGSVYLSQAGRSTDEERGRLLQAAEGKLLDAENRKPGAGAYNLACVAALRGDADGCRSWLEQARDHGTVGSRHHMLADPDLVSVRKQAWFTAFIAALDGSSNGEAGR